MKRTTVALVAVIGLTLTGITGCSSTNESTSTVTSVAEQSELTPIEADCDIASYEVGLEVDRQESAGMEVGSQESYDGTIAMFARIWPQMTDPDLKSILREMADGTEGQIADDPNWSAFRSICGI